MDPWFLARTNLRSRGQVFQQGGKLDFLDPAQQRFGGGRLLCFVLTAINKGERIPGFIPVKAPEQGTFGL